MSQTNAAPAVQTAPQTAPTNGAEPVVLSGGESPASWDELDSLTATARSTKAKEPKEVKEPKQKTEKKETSAPKSEDEDESSEEKASQKTDAPKKEEGKKEAKGVEKPESPAKLLKVKSGESELEIASDALVPVKIDGKTVEVTLQEALNRYSQQSHLDKLYKSYKTEKETFETERKQISDALNKSYDYLVSQKDLRGFLDYLGEAMGVDSHQLYQDAIGNVQKQLEEFQGMSAEERRIRELEMENNYHRSKVEKAKQAKEEAKSRSELESEVTSVMQKYGMEKSDLVKSWDELTGLGYKAEDITPEFLGSYHANIKKIELIEGKLGEISPEIAQNAEIVEQLATYAIQTGANDSEIVEAISQLYGETPEKKLAKKIDKNMRANAQKGSKSQKNPSSDMMFFDDL